MTAKPLAVAPLFRPPVIDLYCGAGGLSLGAARAGFEVAAGVELDGQALATHRANFPVARHLQADVSHISGIDLMLQAGVQPGTLAGLIGGPPCQGFSVIGERDPGDSRNALFGHFMRLVAETLPAFFLAENVPGIAQEKNGAVLRAAMNRVPSVYSVLPPLRVVGSQFGAPTSRERLFFIGVNTERLSALDATAFAPPEGTVTVTVREALRGLSPVVGLPSEEGVVTWRRVRVLPTGPFFERVQFCIPPGVGDRVALKMYRDHRSVNGHVGVAHSPEIALRYEALAPGRKDPISRSVRLKLDGYCPTLRAGTGPEKGRRQAVRPIHPTQPRVITPREAARLQGFPDWFVLPNTKWHSFRQLGNSVSPIVAEGVLSVLFKHVQRQACEDDARATLAAKIAA